MNKFLAAVLLLLVAVSASAVPPGPPSSVTGYPDVVAVFGSGSCSGYLKSDGTCETPAGTGDTIAPATTTQYKIPLWGASNKTLVDGVAVGNAGQLLRSSGDGANPAWSTETYAAPGAVGAVLCSDGTNWARCPTPALQALTLTGTNSLSVGTSSSYTGSILFKNATNSNIFSIISGVSGAALSWTLPTAAPGGANYLLNVDADGTMGYTDPASFAAASAIDAYGDVVALFGGGSCSGYLKSDGTCDTPSAGHNPVTLGATATSILDLSTQEIGFDTQTAHYVLAGPATGEAAAPTFRALVATDIPTLNQNTTGTAAGLTSQYIDWNSASGGNSIANKPTLGSVAALSSIGPTNLSSTDFGDFTCNGTTCTLDTSYQPAHAYLTTVANGGDANNILGMNSAGNGLEFKSSLNVSVSGLTASRMLESNASGVLSVADSATTGTGSPVKGTGPTLSVPYVSDRIELGHASDTSLTRASSGVVAVEGLSLPRIVASGSVTSDQGSISSGACSSAIDGGTATGVATTDRIVWNFNGDPTSITGFAPSASGGLFIYAYPASDHVYFKVCNNTASAVNPGSITLNWMVLR